MSNIILSDGVRIPKGKYTAFSSIGTDFNPEYYPNPYTYKPWRFADLRKQPGNENKYRFVTTSQESISFGHGKHACPGRFFASNEIKIILA
jgi:cytochrome P450